MLSDDDKAKLLVVKETNANDLEYLLAKEKELEKELANLKIRIAEAKLERGL